MIESSDEATEARLRAGAARRITAAQRRAWVNQRREEAARRTRDQQIEAFIKRREAIEQHDSIMNDLVERFVRERELSG